MGKRAVLVIVVGYALSGRVLPFRDLLFYDHWGISHVSKSLSFSSVRELKQPLRDNPLVLDHEFSYLELMQALVVEQLNFVIRLKVRATFLDQEVKSMVLSVKKGETRILNKVFYIGKVFVNLIGQWKEGLSTPLWVTSSLPQKQALALYLQGMKSMNPSAISKA